MDLTTGKQKQLVFQCEWQSRERHVAEWFKRLQRDERSADVVLKVRGVELRCHKTVLAVGSGYFYDLFSCDSRPAPATVCLDEYSPRTVLRLLELVYRGRVRLPDDEDADSFAAAARELRIRGAPRRLPSPSPPASSNEDELEPQDMFAQLVGLRRSSDSPSGSSSAGPSPLVSSSSSRGSRRRRRRAQTHSPASPASSVSPASPDSSESCSSRKRKSSADEPPPDRKKTPGSQCREKKYKRYTEDNMLAAVDAVLSGRTTALQASASYRVPSRTLYDRLKRERDSPSCNRPPEPGPPSASDNADADELERSMQAAVAATLAGVASVLEAAFVYNVPADALTARLQQDRRQDSC